MSAPKMAHKTLSFGELVAMAFEIAASYTENEEEIARIAMRSINSVLKSCRCPLPVLRTASSVNLNEMQPVSTKVRRQYTLARAA